MMKFYAEVSVHSLSFSLWQGYLDKTGQDREGLIIKQIEINFYFILT